MQRDIVQLISRETKIPVGRVKNTVGLLDQGNTVPFIARYRKEMTGELDENQIREIEERLNFHRNFAQRKADIMRLIEEQGKLTEELKVKINNAIKSAELEDLYLPFKQKKRTRAGIARENGLEPLAQYLLSFPEAGDPRQAGEEYLSEQVGSPEDALRGAMDIIAEMISEDPEVRKWLREYLVSSSVLTVRAKDPDQDSVYRMYYDCYQEAVGRIVPHRILAINRGEREGFLTVAVTFNEEVVLAWLYRRYLKDGVSVELVRRALADGYKRLLLPSIEREVRNFLTDKAEAHAVNVFSKNLRSLLLQAPVKGKIVLALDPAYRTGCKWAVLDQRGKLLEVGVIYPTAPHHKVKEAEAVLDRLVPQYGVQAVVIGNGTASRETELFVAEFIQEKRYAELSYTIVSEAGASVYSASKLASREFPKLDVSERSAVSIGRRIQDPLAELVKIPPQAAGVGQYQHDIPEKTLEENLAKVVESVVNFVGVDLNTASASLLSYVAGIKTAVAENIIQYRDENGGFRNRKELKKVAKLGPKTFEQCAGFLRISDGEDKLDQTGIHPESYPVTDKLLKQLGINLSELGKGNSLAKLTELRNNPREMSRLADQIAVGLPTLQDIVDSLIRPGRDPRDELMPPVFRTDILKMEDLKPGMVLDGRVHNVTDFGAFIDIGVKQDGLVHISEISDRYIKHPLEVLAIGDVVTVGILAVDLEKSRISLTIKGNGISGK